MSFIDGRDGKSQVLRNKRALIGSTLSNHNHNVQNGTYSDSLVRGLRAFPKGPKLLAVLGLEDLKVKIGMQGMLGTYTSKGLKLPIQYASDATSAVTLVSALVKARLIISS